MNRVNLKKILKNKTNLDFLSENLVVDWISLNIEGLIGERNVKRIARYLSSRFTPSIKVNDGSFFSDPAFCVNSVTVILRGPNPLPYPK